MATDKARFEEKLSKVNKKISDATSGKINLSESAKEKLQIQKRNIEREISAFI